MVAFIQKAHGCIFLYDAIEAQEAQLAISDSRRPERPSSPLTMANECFRLVTLGSPSNPP